MALATLQIKHVDNKSLVMHYDPKNILLSQGVSYNLTLTFPAANGRRVIDASITVNAVSPVSSEINKAECSFFGLKAEDARFLKDYENSK